MKPIQIEPKSISNHSVEDFPNPDGLVRFGFKPNRIKKPMSFSDHLSIGVFMAALVEKYGIEETEDAIKKIPRSKFMNIFSPMQN
ncbi:hypothetical protein YC2023_015782 [Brassica napus]